MTLAAPTSDALVDVLRSCGTVLLTGPVEPDGDSIGACLSLQRWLAELGCNADVAGEPGYRYTWMPGADRMVPDRDVKPGYEAVVVLDGDRHRLLPNVAGAFESACVRGIIDHHASTKEDGYTHTWIDRNATSTCEMIYDAMRRRGSPIGTDLAATLYAGAIFDTGAFRYSNTTPATHRMAAELIEAGIDHAAICMRVLMERTPRGFQCAGQVFSNAEFLLDGQLAIGVVSNEIQQRLELVSNDLEGIVDALNNVRGVQVACLMIEKPDGKVKLSLRSRGRVDVARVATTLSTAGGGHVKAAGATLVGDVAHATASVRAVVEEALAATR
jgi:phosphoesterase RecJ-like protein